MTSLGAGLPSAADGGRLAHDPAGTEAAPPRLHDSHGAGAFRAPDSWRQRRVREHKRAARSAMVIVYDDGTPRTKHVTTNIAFEVNEEAATAISRAYFTVLQAVPGLALQPVAAGRYRDRFERAGGGWRFSERQVQVDLTGDVSRHFRRAPS